MAILVQQSEATAAYRRMYFHCVDATDGISAEVGENGGQPQYSLNGGAWGNTTNVLVAIGNGRYYVELVAATEVNALGIIEGRYKSANTAESVGTTLQVIPYDPYLATQPVNMTQIGGNSVAGNAATLTLKQLDIQNNAGDALICHSTGGGGDGASFLGEAGGHGILSTGGGTNGDGMKLVGGATNGHGLEASGAGTGDGITAVGGGTGHGIHGTGGSTSGHGALLEADTSGNGLNIQGTDGNSGILSDGQGTGNGANFRGGADGNGMECRGGITSGDGIYTHAQDGNGHGIQTKGDPTAGGTGDGISTTGGAAGHGIHSIGGSTSGDGIKAEAAAEGEGIYALAKGTDEHGILAVGGDTSGDGIHAKAATDGNGISGTAVGDNDGILATGSGTGDGLACVAGATGNGLECSATDGDGIKSTGATNGNGMLLTGAGTGDGFASVGAAIGKGGSINVALATTLAVRTSDSIFTLNGGSAADDAYNNMTISLYDVSGNLKESRKIDDYTGLSKTIEVDTAFKFTVAANDIVRIFESSYATTAAAGGGATAAEVWAYNVDGVTIQGYAGTYQKISGGRYG